MSMSQHNPPHPGAFISEVYIEPFEIVSNQLAKKLDVNPSTLNRLLNRKSDISPEMAVKLSVVLGRSPESWLAMQDNFNLWNVRQQLDVSNLQRIQF